MERLPLGHTEKGQHSLFVVVQHMQRNAGPGFDGLDQGGAVLRAAEWLGADERDVPRAQTPGRLDVGGQGIHELGAGGGAEVAVGRHAVAEAEEDGLVQQRVHDMVADHGDEQVDAGGTDVDGGTDDGPGRHDDGGRRGFGFRFRFGLDGHGSGVGFRFRFGLDGHGFGFGFGLSDEIRIDDGAVRHSLHDARCRGLGSLADKSGDLPQHAVRRHRRAVSPGLPAGLRGLSLDLRHGLDRDLERLPCLLRRLGCLAIGLPPGLAGGLLLPLADGHRGSGVSGFDALSGVRALPSGAAHRALLVHRSWPTGSVRSGWLTVCPSR